MTEPLQFTVSSTEGLAPEVAALYAPVEAGGFKLRVAGVVAESEVLGLKKNMEAAVREKKALEGKLGKEFSLDELETLRSEKSEREAERQRMEDEKARSKGDWEKLEAKIRDAAKREVETERTARTAAEQKYHEALTKREATDALNAAGCRKAKKLLPHLTPKLGIGQNEDGDDAVFVREGKSFKIGKGGAYMTPQEFVQSVLREEFPEDFDGTSSTGGGSNGDGGRPAPGGAVKISRVDAANSVAYAAAKARAEKAGVELRVEG